MASLNQVTLIGNCTRDPELRYLSSGQAVCNLGLALNERFKKGDEWVEEVIFVDITVWGRQAEQVAEYVTKGQAVCVQGRLKLDQWEQDGKKQTKLKVVAQRVQFLGAKLQKAATESSYNEPATAGEDEHPAFADLPF